MKKPVSRWIAEVQHDENGDAMVIFPPEFCEQTDQREGDLYDIKAVDGKIVMTFIKHADAILQYPIAILPGNEQTSFSVFSQMYLGVLVPAILYRKLSKMPEKP